MSIKNISITFFLIFSVILPYHTALSKNYIYPTVYLAEFKADTNNNKNPDELFIETTEYIDGKLPIKETRVPQFPSYWTINILPRIKDLPIWDGILKTGQPKVLYIAIKDQDFWSEDDVIGYIKLQLLSDGNIIKSKWEIVNSNQSLVNISSYNSEHLQKIKFISDKAIYIFKIGITLTKKFPLIKKKRDFNKWPSQFPRSYSGIFIQ